MNRIAAIVVTYKRKEKLRRCVEAVLAQTAMQKPDIFIVDNGSCDGTGEMVREMINECGPADRGRIIYEDLGFNSGGSGGFCHGIRRAVEAGYDYLWLMDDDCVPSESALDVLLKTDNAFSGHYGFLSSKVLWKDGSLCKMNIQRRTVFRNTERKVLLNETVPRRIAMASFVSLFIPVKVVRNVGLPFSEFFIWTDDWEYTRRISLKYPCYLVPESEVIHDMPRNTAADISIAEPEQLDRYRYLYRNDVVLYRREGIKGLLYESARLTVHTFRILLKTKGLKEKKRRMGIMLTSTAEGLSFYPETEKTEPE